MIKMTKKQKRYFNIAFFVTIIIATLYIFVKSDIDKQREAKYAKFTVGTIVSEYHHKTTWNPPGRDLVYTVNGNERETTIRIKGKIGDKYLVIFDSTNYKANTVLEIYPVYGNPIPPASGWTYDNIPLSISKTKVENYLNDLRVFK